MPKQEAPLWSKVAAVALVISMIAWPLLRSPAAPSPTEQAKVDASIVQAGNAEKLCALFKNAGVTAECDVKAWGQTVDVRIDTSGPEAQTTCDGVVALAVKNNTHFGDFQLRIFSPFSGDHPLATCKLPL